MYGVVLVAYLLGSMPTAVIAGRLRGIDVRAGGSGNPGATNVFRLLGPQAALAVLLIDAIKGWIAVALLAEWEAGDVDWLPLAAGAAAIVGHVWPVWSRFHGGKGVATTLGVVLALAPWVALALLAIFGILLLLWRRVSLASLGAALCLPLALLFGGDPWREPTSEILFALFVSLLLVWSHRANIRRLIAGDEPRLDRN